MLETPNVWKSSATLSLTFAKVMELPFSRLDFSHPMKTSSAFFEKAETSKPMPGKGKSKLLDLEGFHL